MANPSDIQREMFAAWHSRDFQKMRSLVHPEYTYTGPDGEEQVGPDAGIEIARMYAAAFPDGRIEVQRIHTAGDVSIAEFLARGTHQGELMGVATTGKPVEILICNVMEIRDGKVYREREYMDVLTLLSQIGAVTFPGRGGADRNPGRRFSAPVVSPTSHSAKFYDDCSGPAQRNKPEVSGRKVGRTELRAGRRREVAPVGGSGAARASGKPCKAGTAGHPCNPCRGLTPTRPGCTVASGLGSPDVQNVNSGRVRRTRSACGLKDGGVKGCAALSRVCTL